MSEELEPAIKSKKPWHKRKWLWIVMAIPLLLIVGYLVITSEVFFTGVILPQVSNALGAKVTVRGAEIHPWSQAVLKQLKLETVGAEPLLTAQEVRVRYNLRDIIKGKLNVAELTIASPVMQVIYNPDGTSNLDPLLKPRPQKASKKPKPKSSEPSQVDLRNLTLKGATVRITKNLKDGSRETSELANTDITLSQLANGRPGSLTVSSDLKFQQQAGATNDFLQGRITAKYDFELLPELVPQNLKGNAQLNILQAGGAMKDFVGLGLVADADVTPKEIKQAALRFIQSGQPLGEVSLSGPFDPARTEGKLRVEVRAIDRQVLNLFGARHGLDFGPTALNSTNEIELAQNGSLFISKGQLTATKFSVTKDKNTTPPLDLAVNYQATIDRQKQSAVIQSLTLAGTKDQQPLLAGNLSKPMKLVWAKTGDLVDESNFRLEVTRLNLADWKPFVGDYAGIVSLTLNVLSQQAGKRLQFELASQADGVRAARATNAVTLPQFDLRASGRVEEFNRVMLTSSRAVLGPTNEPALTVAASGQFDRASNDATGELTVEATLPRIAPLLRPGQLSAAAGTFTLRTKFAQSGKAQKASGNAVLANFSGQYAQYRFNNYGAALTYDAEFKDDQALLRSLKLTIQEGTQSGGGIDATGDWNLAKKSGQLDFKTMNLNERAVRPFLETMLGNKKLVSVALSANAWAHYDARGESALKGDFQVARLTVIDPENRLPNTPLEAKIQLDALQRNQVLDLRQFQITLSPTYRAKNEIRLAGKVDLTKADAVAGQIKLTSDSVDITPYYDLFAGSPTNAASTAKPAQTEMTAAAAAAVEPPAKQFPLRQFSVDVNVDRLYVREVAITNWQGKAIMDGGRLVLSPCTFALNGAPVTLTADLDLGVPGYRYDVAFRATKVPVAPLANSFSPDYRGKAQGDLLANIQIKGAGTTGVNLQKNLTGQADLVFTNAHIELVGRKAKLLITPIAFVLRLNELTKAPVKWAAANISFGDGKINLRRTSVVSEAFIAETHGQIPIAPIFTNSPLNHLPVDFSLRRSIAESANLMPADAPTNAAFVKLPPFVQIAGTLGRPEPKTDSLVIATLIGRSALGLTREGGKVIKKVGSEADKILPGLGTLLTGEKPATSTNRPATNPPVKFNPLDLLKPKKQE